MTDSKYGQIVYTMMIFYIVSIRFFIMHNPRKETPFTDFAFSKEISKFVVDNAMLAQWYLFLQIHEGSYREPFGAILSKSYGTPSTGTPLFPSL